ncbi:MAG: response regulator [Candidatus Magnetominusculus sp. LBB02]|nr:response regulator [Candidatus Magnetominusculus sp. LBB02]
MMTILVVEEDALSRKLVSEILRRNGHVVFGASDGNEGIRIAKEQRPALALINAQLYGELDGRTTAKQLKQDNTTRHVVAITDFTGTDVERRIFESGYDAFVSTPITRYELLQTISSFSAGSAL